MKHRFLYIYSAFIISLVILVLLAFVFQQRLDAMISANRSSEGTYKVLTKVQTLDASLNEIESGSRGYMLTGDSQYLKPLSDKRQFIAAALDTLQNIVGDDKQRNKLAFIRSTIMLRLHMMDENVRMAANHDTTGLGKNLLKGKFMMDDLHRDLDELNKRESYLLHEHLRQRQVNERKTPDYFRTILFFTSLITLIGFFFLNKELRVRLRYQKKLERKINELHRSNEELRQLAHVASHDLQEPLRKIRMFSNLLVGKNAAHIDEETNMLTARIDAAASHMHELLHEISNFTNLISSTEMVSPVNLQVIVQRAVKNFSEEIKEKNAQVQVGILPLITGYPNQLYLLFASLLDNALKFTREGEAPVVSIGVQQAQYQNRLYHRITVEDNGIGFDNAFSAKIFVLFQRLHSQQSGYKGKGIGLAIVQRVMVNHNGLVFARGTVGNGAVVELYFPVDDDD